MDVDKKLSEIKSTIPLVNPNLSGQIYHNYKNKSEKNRSNHTMFKKLSFIFSTIILLMVVILMPIFSNKNNEKVNLYNDAMLLTEVVYNYTVKENEDYQISNKSVSKKFSNHFQYSILNIHRSYGFEITLDFIMTPYFDDYEIGDKVDVVIAMIDLYDSDKQVNPIGQSMIILNYKDQIYGFLSPTYGTINDLNPRIEDELEFSTCMFLTKNEVVKYYERGDYIYDFTLKEMEAHNIKLSAVQSIAFNEDILDKEYEVSVIEGSYTELSSGEVIDLIKLSFVERIEVQAIIKEVDLENNKIYIICESVPSLASVTYAFTITDSSGKLYQITDLKIGDKIWIYYYQRYQNYSPVNIRVDNIVIQ